MTAGKLAAELVLRGWVEEKLGCFWSPQQISRQLVLDFPDDTGMRVSHETIYTSLFVQTKAVLRTELTGTLRTRRVRRRPHRRVATRTGPGRIPNLLPIRERPAEVLDRATPGHWEGDLVVGRHGRSHVATLVERHSRYLLVLPLPDGAGSTQVIGALTAVFNLLPATMRRSLTRDRGIEMTRHALFTAATGIPVYFADTYCPWQRGSNENSNGLLGQYLPKKTDLSLTSPARLTAIVNELNQRPRRALRWKTPHEVYRATSVALIAWTHRRALVSIGLPSTTTPTRTTNRPPNRLKSLYVSGTRAPD